MNPERWKRIEHVYNEALASSVTDRAAILSELCADDSDLRREVESLLAAREDAGDFLFRPDLAALASESHAAGESLGPYVFLSSIGAGAMGEVYLARDTRLDRKVALKILPNRFTEDDERVARFQREARLASALNHPNIIAIYDIGRVGETWYLAAEFVEGRTVRDRLSAGKLDLEEALAICIQCTEALEAAHQAGIIHRDIKPENIMVRSDGAVKVVDFGLARIAGGEMELTPDATRSGTLIGTPRYMSPEQARGRKLDPRCDIFSLGAVLFEMVSGKPAFPGDTAAEVFAALLGSARPQCEDAPPALNAVLSRALEPDADRRYSSMQEFGSALRNWKMQPRTSARNRILRRSAMAAVTAGAAAWLWTSRTRSHTGRPMPSVIPLTSFAGSKDFGSFAPDGERVAFSWNGGKDGRIDRNIYIKAIGPDDPVQLTSAAADDRVPAWSPDGRSIAFCRHVWSQRHDICLIRSAGALERKVAEGGLGVSWSPDGRTLAIGGLHEQGGGVVLLDLATGKRRAITTPAQYTDSLPAFSPDGQFIAFSREFIVAAREIFVVPAAGGTPKQLTFDRQPTYGITWTGDSREVVFSSNRGRGGESLWRIPAGGGEPRPLLGNPQGGEFSPSISRRGNRLVYTVSFKDTNIYAYDGPGFTGHPVPGRYNGPRALITSSRRDDSPSLSPSGDRIVFVSKRTGNEELWIADANGAHLTQVTSFKGPAIGTPRWSPDGLRIAFDSLAAGSPDIYVMQADGRNIKRLTRAANNYMPSWSQDGQWIYYKSDHSGDDQSWRIPSGGGDPVQITRHGAGEAHSSADGRLIYYNKHGFGPIWMARADGSGGEQPVAELKQFDQVFRAAFGVLPEGIFFISKEDRPRQTVRFFSFATRQVSTLVVLDRDLVWDYPGVALSRDGKRLICALLDQEVNDLMLIEDFS